MKGECLMARGHELMVDIVGRQAFEVERVRLQKGHYHEKVLLIHNNIVSFLQTFDNDNLINTDAYWL